LRRRGRPSRPTRRSADLLAGQPHKPTAVHEVARAGIARTFQNSRLFADMTALENVMVGRHVRTQSGILGAMFRTRKFKEEEAAIDRKSTRLNSSHVKSAY